ncbi:MAG: hypothetical protein P8186_17970 [Anaerolineae bacterium]
MNTQRIFLIVSLISAGLLAAACGSAPPAPTPDVEAAVQTAIAQTRVFEDAVATSIAATLAANAPQITPTASQLPTTTPTPQVDVPTPTNTPPLPTATPIPASTEEKLAIAESDVDGNDGNDFLRGSSDSNQGRVVLLPGFAASEVTRPVVFRDRMVFRVEVFDTRIGLVDGAGIQDVTFQIVADAGNGEVVYERQENNPGYCVFGGGEPNCNVLVFAESGNRWPDPFGGEILNGQYLAIIDIVPVDREPAQWRWSFNIEIPGQPEYGSPAPDNTARITGITVQDGRYIVDFETFGFKPLVPGQHVHFFFNTVPPEQAGTPGSGPWQIYPTGPGQPNTSPFTLYTIAQRPADATQLCILVANQDHSVNPGTGNCVDLP